MQPKLISFEYIITVLMTLRFRYLLLGWLTTHILLGIICAEVYYVPSPQLFKPGNSPAHCTFWDALHFAYTTQSTIGYGDFVPQGTGRWIAHLQALFGVVLNGLAFTAIASKILYAVPNVRFSKRVLYNPDINMFWLRYMNDEPIELIDAEIRFVLQKPLSNSGDALYDTALHVIHVSRMEESLPFLRVMALKTECDRGKYVRADPAVRNIDRVSPPHLRPTNANPNYTPRLLVTISGFPLGSSNRFSVQQGYSVDDVICGKFATPVDNALYADLRGSKLKKQLNALFDDIVPTTLDRCESCPHKMLCPLKPLSRENETKFFSSIPYKSSRLIYKVLHRDWQNS